MTRLEGARKDLMLGIIHSKREELAAICATARLEMPALPDVLGERGEVVSKPHWNSLTHAQAYCNGRNLRKYHCLPTINRGENLLNNASAAVDRSS